MRTFEKFLAFILSLSLIILAIYVFFFVSFKVVEIGVQQDTYKIREEEHIDNLYGIYQSNLSGCMAKAEEEKKDNAYINEVCVNEINNSIVADWLIEYGYEELLQEPLPVE